MNALSVVEQEPSCTDFAAAVAIRMADEGIPVRAIARSTRLPSDDVYEILRDAIGRGSLVELPKDDWPAGTTRSRRFAKASTPFDDDEALKVACARCFRATRLEAAILTLMLKRNEVTKQQLHLVIEQNRPGENRDETDPKMVDVVICHLRKKLRPHAIDVETVWGIGYLIAQPAREVATALIMQFYGLAEAA